MSTRLQAIEDAAYAKAVEAVRKLGSASIQILQDTARCSYNGAHVFLTRMQADGLIGPAGEDGTHEVFPEARKP